MLNLIGTAGNIFMQFGIRREFRFIIITPIINSVNKISRG